MILPSIVNGDIPITYKEEILPTDNFIKTHDGDVYFMSGLKHFKLELKLEYMFADVNNPGIDITARLDSTHAVTFNTGTMGLVDVILYLHNDISENLLKKGKIINPSIEYQGCCQILSDDSMVDVLNMVDRSSLATVIKILSLGSMRIQLALGIVPDHLPVVDPYDLNIIMNQYTAALLIAKTIKNFGGSIEEKRRTKKYREAVYDMYNLLGKLYIDHHLKDESTIINEDDTMISQSFEGVQRIFYKKFNKETL